MAKHAKQKLPNIIALKKVIEGSYTLAYRCSELEKAKKIFPDKIRKDFAEADDLCLKRSKQLQNLDKNLIDISALNNLGQKYVISGFKDEGLKLICSVIFSNGEFRVNLDNEQNIYYKCNNDGSYTKMIVDGDQFMIDGSFKETLVTNSILPHCNDH